MLLLAFLFPPTTMQIPHSSKAPRPSVDLVASLFYFGMTTSNALSLLQVGSVFILIDRGKELTVQSNPKLSVYSKAA